MGIRLFTDTEEEEIKKLYMHGFSARRLARGYGCNFTTILDAVRRSDGDVRASGGWKGSTSWLKGRHLPLYLRENLSRNWRKYPFENQRFFEVIDTAEKAYWLGFLYADGYVSRHSLEIVLQQGDRGHLVALKAALKSGAPVVDFMNRGKYPASRFIVHSLSMRRDLEKHGVFQCKSKCLTWPSALPGKLDSHFIRGVFDGDGGIYRAYEERSQFELNSGSEGFLGDVGRRLAESCALSRTNLYHYERDNGEWWSLRYGGSKQVTRIIRFLYAGSVAETRLDRKYDNVKLILQQMPLRDFPKLDWQTCGAPIEESDLMEERLRALGYME